MSEADAQYGHFLGQQFQELQAVSGVERIAGAGGQADHIELAAGGQIQKLRPVVADDLRMFAELEERLHEVEREGVKVINK